MIDMQVLWLSVAGIAAIIEIATTTMVSIWFTVGGLAAFVACQLGAPPYVQLGIFAVVSGCAGIAFRPLARKHAKPIPTNLDMLIGHEGVVEEDIAKDVRGLVFVDGKHWSAEADENIARDERVIILEITGSHLIVKKKEVA